MRATKEEKIDLIKSINEMKNGSMEQMWLTITYCLEAYFRCLQVFGADNRVTRENILIIKEMFTILNIERRFLNYIRFHLGKFDSFASLEVLGLLDDINERTVNYYYDLMDDIDDAIDTGQEFRGYRPRIPFLSLINDPSYATEVIALGENLESIQEFLDYEEAFGDYIKDKTKTEDEENATGVYPIIDDNNITTDLRIVLPDITNLESALKTIKVLEEAHEVYQMIGKPFIIPNDEHPTELEDKYKNDYLINKARKALRYKNVK